MSAEIRFYKDPAIAVVLSFLYTGLGQLYNGQYLKGLFLMVVYGLSWLSMLILIGYLTTPVIWLFGMFDAYASAKRINAEIGPDGNR